jgi:hypothetical protein
VGAAKGVAGMYAKGGGGMISCFEVSGGLIVAVYAVPARITQGVYKEFQKRLFFEQEDVILEQRRKEARQAAEKVDLKTKEEILEKWKNLKIERIPQPRRRRVGDPVESTGGEVRKSDERKADEKKSDERKSEEKPRRRVGGPIEPRDTSAERSKRKGRRVGDPIEPKDDSKQ